MIIFFLRLFSEWVIKPNLLFSFCITATKWILHFCHILQFTSNEKLNLILPFFFTFLFSLKCLSCLSSTNRKFSSTLVVEKKKSEQHLIMIAGSRRCRRFILCRHIKVKLDIKKVLLSIKNIPPASLKSGCEMFVLCFFTGWFQL